MSQGESINSVRKNYVFRISHDVFFPVEVQGVFFFLHDMSTVEDAQPEPV
jgi:hypothetical protein